MEMYHYVYARTINTAISRPFVSANNGNGLILQGEIYGGAIYPQLARIDYLPLQMAPLSDGTLQVRISNDLKAKLLVSRL